MNKIQNLKTVAAVERERERERERESLYSTWNSFTRPQDCLLENKKVNNVENINNNKEFNKGRTMPIFEKGIGLSLFAFVKEKIVVQKLNYILHGKCYIGIESFRYKFLKKVRAGP